MRRTHRIDFSCMQLHHPELLAATQYYCWLSNRKFLRTFIARSITGEVENFISRDEYIQEGDRIYNISDTQALRITRLDTKMVFTQMSLCHTFYVILTAKNSKRKQQRF